MYRAHRVVRGRRCGCAARHPHGRSAERDVLLLAGFDAHDSQHAQDFWRAAARRHPRVEPFRLAHEQLSVLRLRRRVPDARHGLRVPVLALGAGGARSGAGGAPVGHQQQHSVRALLRRLPHLARDVLHRPHLAGGDQVDLPVREGAGAQEPRREPVAPVRDRSGVR